MNQFLDSSVRQRLLMVLRGDLRAPEFSSVQVNIVLKSLRHYISKVAGKGPWMPLSPVVLKGKEAIILDTKLQVIKFKVGEKLSQITKTLDLCVSTIVITQDNKN